MRARGVACQWISVAVRYIIFIALYPNTRGRVKRVDIYIGPEPADTAIDEREVRGKGRPVSLFGVQLYARACTLGAGLNHRAGRRDDGFPTAYGDARRM